jgi:hypothetical protein
MDWISTLVSFLEGVRTHIWHEKIYILKYLNANFDKYPGKLLDLFFFLKYLATAHFWNRKNNNCDDCLNGCLSKSFLLIATFLFAILLFVYLMVFNAIFNNISVISWWSASLFAILLFVYLMVFNAIFNNISVISWWSASLFAILYIMTSRASLRQSTRLCQFMCCNVPSTFVVFRYLLVTKRQPCVGQFRVDRFRFHEEVVVFVIVW